jgi:hypothetical protein
MVLVALEVVISLPGVAAADYAYVQTWYEKGLDGPPAELKTWNITEAVIETDGATWTGTGLSGLTPGWTATLLSPTIALATKPTYDVGTSDNFFCSPPPARRRQIFRSRWTGCSGMAPPSWGGRSSL